MAVRERNTTAFHYCERVVTVNRGVSVTTIEARESRSKKKEL